MGCTILVLSCQLLLISSVYTVQMDIRFLNSFLHKDVNKKIVWVKGATSTKSTLVNLFRIYISEHFDTKFVLGYSFFT